MNSIYDFPRLVVEVQNHTWGNADLRNISEVRIQQRLSLPALCELTLRDPPGPLAVARGVLPGASLRVSLQGERTALFSGQVTAVEYGYEGDQSQSVYIRGYDGLHRLRKQQTVRLHSDMTVLRLANELIKGMDLKVQASEVGPRFARIYQHHQTDLELLVETAAAAGLYLTLREGLLYLLTLAGIGEPQSLTLGANLHEAHIEINADAACETVAATAWNPLDAEVYYGRATQPRSGRRLQGALSTAQLNGAERYDLVNEGAVDQPQVEALAQAELDYRKAGEVVLTGLAQGSPQLQPGTPIQVQGVADMVAGRYVLTEVTHLINRTGGYLAEISTAPPPRPPRPRTDVATVGIVTQVDAQGRVRAKLPTYNQVESDWMGVLTPGAGKNKGMIALPNPGDTVLVLLTHENPGRGIVLGGLYGQQSPPDSGVTSGSVQRYSWITAGGQRIQLDDSGNIIRLENESGSYIELAGGQVTIGGQAIDFRRTG
jgi:uncharacterized protein involved in type VI secretion and phage assembly